MPNTKALTMAAVFIAGLAAASPAAAKVKDPAVTAASTESVVLMRADRYRFDWGLVLGREGQSGFGSRVYVLNVHPFDGEPFVGKTLAPGTYRLNSITQQRHWASCLGNGTVSFTVLPGKVYYLGTLNSHPLLEDLQQSSTARGKSSVARGESAVGWQPAVKPEFAPPSPEELAEVRQFMSASMPRTTAPIAALPTAPSTFRTGGGKKLMQICG
jgi:hypothetical protein